LPVSICLGMTKIRNWGLPGPTLDRIENHGFCWVLQLSIFSNRVLKGPPPKNIGDPFGFALSGPGAGLVFYQNQPTLRPGPRLS